MFKAELPVREAQIIQKSLDRIHVRYVPAVNFHKEAERSIAGRLRDRLGDVEVTFEQVSQVPRTSNGKFRAVLCELSPQELAGIK